MASFCGEVLGDACPLSRKFTLVRWTDAKSAGVLWIDAFEVIEKLSERTVCRLDHYRLLVIGAAFWF